MGRTGEIHEQAERLHLNAAALHDDAAGFWAARGYPPVAARERERAREERAAALAEHALAREGFVTPDVRPPLAACAPSRPGESPPAGAVARGV